MPDVSVSTRSFAAETKTRFKGPRLRLALVGCGGIAEVHLDALRTMPDVEIVAGVDIQPQRLKVMQDKFNIPRLYSDWKRMLREIRPDAVDVCTPNAVHAPAAVDALRFGCHVFTEKPMALNPRQCQQMIRAAAKARRKLAVGFQYRYHPSTQFLKRAGDEGRFGKILFVKCQALRRRGIPNWGVFGQKHLQGGGPMIDIGVHVIEMAHYLMGSPKPLSAQGNVWTYLGDKPSRVASMWPGWDYKTYNVEDLAAGQVRFAGGAMMQIETSFAAHIEKDVWNFTLAGEKGGCSWDPPMIFTDRAGTMVNESPAFTGDGSWNALFAAKLRNFIDACLRNTPLEAPGEAGLAVQTLIDAVYRSADAGREIRIP